MNGDSTQRQVVTLFDFLHAARLGWKRILLVPFALGLVALAATFALPPEFTAKTKFLPPTQQQNSASAMLQSLGALGGLSGLATGATGLKNPLDQYVSIARSRTLATALAERFNFKAKYKEDTLEGALRVFEEKSRVVAGKDGVLTIEIDDEDPKVAAEIANTYTREFSIMLSRFSSSEARYRREFFEKQVLEAKKELLRLDGLLSAANVSLSEIRKIPGATVTALADLNNRVESLEARRAAYLSYMTSSAAPVKIINAELEELKNRRDALSNSGNKNANGDYIASYRDYKFQEMLFEMLMRQYELAKVDEARGGGTLQIIDVAVAPERKSKPRRMLITIGVVVTVFAVMIIHLLIGLALDIQKKPRAIPENG
jgi:uncharacterized protein involved in exopolysaccharide biosynthesis